MAAYGSLYSLTPMTGRTSGSERTTVIGTVEMKWRTFWIGIFALIPGGFLTLMFFFLIREWAFLWIPIVEIAAFYLIERRTGDGLNVRTYQAIVDKKKSNINTFYLCGQPVDIEDDKHGIIRQITVPVKPAAVGPGTSTREYFEDFN